MLNVKGHMYRWGNTTFVYCKCVKEPNTFRNLFTLGQIKCDGILVATARARCSNILKTFKTAQWSQYWLHLQYSAIVPPLHPFQSWWPAFCSSFEKAQGWKQEWCTAELHGILKCLSNNNGILVAATSFIWPIVTPHFTLSSRKVA